MNISVCFHCKKPIDLYKLVMIENNKVFHVECKKLCNRSHA